MKLKKVGASDDVYYPIKLFPIKSINNVVNNFAGSAILPPTAAEVSKSAVVLFDGTNLVGTIFASQEEMDTLTSARDGNTSISVTLSETQTPFATI